MIDFHYTTELNHRYLLIRSPEEPQDSYDVRILMTNEIPGVLRMDREAVNGQQYYRFEVTGYRSFTELLKENRLKETDIRRLLKNLFAMLSNFESYLLDPDHLLLTADHLYADPDRLMPGTVYLPFIRTPIRQSLADLARVIMLKQDEENSSLIMLLCHLMQDLEDDLPLDEIRSRLFQQPEPGGISYLPERAKEKEPDEPADDTPVFIGEQAPEPYSGWSPAGDLDDEWRMSRLMAGPDIRWEEDKTAGEVLPGKDTVRIACFAAFPAVLVYGALQLQSWLYLTPYEITGAVLGTASIMLLAGVRRRRK